MITTDFQAQFLLILTFKNCGFVHFQGGILSHDPVAVIADF